MVDNQASPIKKKNIEDYEFLKQIGEGAFGVVYLAKEKETSKMCAIKALDIQHILKFNKAKNVNREKEILTIFQKHPNIIRLDATFKDKQNLYFVFEHCPNGTLSGLIKKNGCFNEYITKIYAAEIVNVLETIHSNNVMHRDMKPENILLTDKHHLKIIDFGDANYIELPPDELESEESKQHQEAAQDTQTNRFTNNFDEFSRDAAAADRRGTFVGTAFYVSPEMLSINQAQPASDIWALGCIIYKMLSGNVPFQGTNDYQTFQMILERKLEFPSGAEAFSEDAEDLIDKLLQIDPEKRLGAGKPGSDNDYKALKSHPFFKGINFEDLNSKELPLARKISDSDHLNEKNGNQQWTDLLCNDTSIEQIYQGELKKKNKFFWNQVRTFVLFADGKLNYYKDKALFRGSIQLTPDSKVIKTAKDKFEIVTPTRTYLLSESENARLTTDNWIDNIRQVIGKLNCQLYS